MSDGFVYFIACGDRVKIGYSEDPVRRLTKINADAPAPCELLGYVSANDFPESELHGRFASIRIHSEWFALTAEIRAFIESSAIGGVRGDRFDRRDLTDAAPLMRWRYAAKLRQQDAAARVGVTLCVWNRWECGKASVSAKRVLDVEALTGISRHELRPDVFGPAKESAA